MPNPKYFEEYELSNVYLLYGFIDGGTLDITNNDFAQDLDDMFVEAHHQRVEESTDKFVDWYHTADIDPADVDKPISFRMAYKYIENGQEKFIRKIEQEHPHFKFCKAKLSSGINCSLFLS